jgi:hypothetical protein
MLNAAPRTAAMRGAEAVDDASTRKTISTSEALKFWDNFLALCTE